VCEHTPVAAEDCKPNKSLRTTIKVFLRTEEKKREAAKLKEAKETPPQTPIEATPIGVHPVPDYPETPVEASVDTPQAQVQSVYPKEAVDQSEEVPENNDAVEQSNIPEHQDIPQQSIEVRKNSMRSQ
jgi:hypothetical protein